MTLIIIWIWLLTAAVIISGWILFFGGYWFGMVAGLKALLNWMKRLFKRKEKPLDERYWGMNYKDPEDFH